MRVFVEGVGLLGPGLAGWHASRSLLSGNAPYIAAPTMITANNLLPPAERRRAGVPVKLALAVGYEAFTNAGCDASVTATVFTSSGGDNDNVHQLCETLATSEREISPTRFHNSVHNAAAGYWSIAVRSQAPSTSLCCYDASFAAGLLEAAASVAVDRCPIALIAYDHPYPEPLGAVRKVSANFGMALLFTPEPTERTLACLEITFAAGELSPTRMLDRDLEAMRTGIPAARSLPLLSALVRGIDTTLVLEYLAGSHVQAVVTMPSAFP